MPRGSENDGRSLRARAPCPWFFATGLLLASSAHAHEGWGIVVDRAGAVYFADIPANAVWKVSKGKVEKVAANKHSHALVLDPSGALYGTNPHLTLPIRSVWRRAPDGSLADLLPPTENLPLGLQSFTRDHAGNIYSASAWNARAPEVVLLRRSPDGAISRVAGGAVGHADGVGPQARFLGIDGMAWGPYGLLYLTDGPYVRRVGPDGSVTTLGEGPITERRWDEDLLGIAVDAGGNVSVADHAGRRIVRITPTGKVSTALTTGSIWTPTGVAVAADGLYVLEHLRLPLAILGDLAVGPYLRVRKVSPDGEATVLARLWGRRTIPAVAVVAAVVAATAVFRRRRRRRKVV